MTRSFRKGRQTSKLSLPTLLLLSIVGASATTRYNCYNLAPHAPLEENKLRTQTSPPHTLTVMQDGKIIYQGQTPSHLRLRPGNYIIIVGRTLSYRTVAMAYYADGSWTSTSTCVLENPRATIRLTMLNNANTTAHLISRNPHDGTQLTHSLVVFSIVFQPPLQVNRSAAGQPSTAPYNTVTNATSGATITGTPAPHLANGTTTAWQDQAGTTPAGDDSSVPAHNCTAGAGRKGCVSDQPSVASATNEQPANATASSPEVSSSTGAIVGGAIGSVVAVAIIVLSICGWRRGKTAKSG